MPDIWELIENPPDYAKETAALYHWSTNYDCGRGPFTLFLDLIGWSDENIGENLFAQNYAECLGYLEIDYLADALKEYANRPTEVIEFVDSLMLVESGDDD